MMKLWIAAATLLFLVFLVFFARQFPRYNLLFAGWLLLGVVLQGVFAILAAINQTKSFPVLPLTILGWMLVCFAILKAYRSQDAVNGIIFAGLLAHVLLQAFASVAAHLYDKDSPTHILASNAAIFAPLGYMLARFMSVYSDSLPLIASLRDSVFGRRASEVFGYARSLLS